MSTHSDSDMSVSEGSFSDSESSQVEEVEEDDPAVLIDLTTPEGGSLTLTIPGRHWIMGDEAFRRTMPHHAGMKQLWETKWKLPCAKGLYPFHDGKYGDFDVVFRFLIENNINDGTSLAYTKAFIRQAEVIVSNGDWELKSGNGAAAGDLYLRACAVYRIARFPYITSRPGINDAAKWHAWTAQKEIYMKASRTWNDPIEEVMVPFMFRQNGSVEGREIPVYVRVPKPNLFKRETVILFTGLDGYRPDNTQRCNEFLKRNWATVVVEIPGTADCPADPADTTAPERLLDSLIAWMEDDGRFDMKRVMVWGLSAGGYYAIRAAHTHAKKLVGVVAQGAGCHHFFDREWIERMDGHELTPALAMKHGYSSIEDYKKGVQEKFSLLESGILDLACTRLLLINGVMDGLMPIEDSMMLFEHGSVKEARFLPGTQHMGYPGANDLVYPWMEAVMAQAAAALP